MIFIDTGAFIARYVARDRFHQSACAYWQEVEMQRERCITSNFVLDETATLLGRIAGNHFSAKRLKNVYSSTAMEVHRPDREDELQALKWFTKYADQGVTFTDCISFVLMNNGRLKRVFSFDRHFDLAGFTRVPDRL